MKLPYEKPQVAVENYILSQTVAACNVKIGFSGRQCIIDDEDMLKYPTTLSFAYGGLFLTKPDCTDVATNADVYDGLCYHTKRQRHVCFLSHGNNHVCLYRFFGPYSPIPVPTPDCPAGLFGGLMIPNPRAV